MFPPSKLPQASRSSINRNFHKSEPITFQYVKQDILFLTTMLHKRSNWEMVSETAPHTEILDSKAQNKIRF